MTKIIHFNIALTRSQKELKFDDVEFLYIMMNSVVIDVAECILNEMIAFKEKAPARANIPFVAMISSLCTTVGSSLIGDNLIQPPIEHITLTLVKKSTTMSRPPIIPPTELVDISSTSTAPPPKKKKSWKARIESYIKKLMCCQPDINHKLSHKIDYCVQAVEQYTGILYIPPESDTKEIEEEENDKEEEEEGDDLE